MLAIARALMTNPALLLLDEPLEGLAPIIVEELTAAIRRITSDEGTAFILVEQHAEVALSLTEHAVVLERGSIVHRARSRDLLQDQATLDRLIGLRLDSAGNFSTKPGGICALNRWERNRFRLRHDFTQSKSRRTFRKWRSSLTELESRG